MDEIPPEVPGYRVTRLLGSGSTARVWRARRVSDDELVAIKVLDGDHDPDAVREYAMLQHAAGEHVVTLHEALEVHTDRGPVTALVLQYLAGGSLAQVVAQRGHLSPGECVTVIVPIAQAVAGLHDRGIVHGDLSPGNVLLDSTGRPVLADLGLARLTGEEPGDVYGTEGFVAPEVLEGGDPDRASDVHSLGALAWLCLTGAPPGHVVERPDLRDELPGARVLAAVVQDCLAGDPATRPEAHEVARAVFDATPAQPVRWTSPGDVASGLTQRIREAAAQEGLAAPPWQRELAGAGPPGPRRRWWRRPPRPSTREPRDLPRSGRHAAPRRAGDERIDLTRDVSGCRSIARSATHRSGWRPGQGAALVAGFGLLLALLVPWQHLASGVPETGGPGPSTVRAAAARAPAATASPAAPVQQQRSAPRSSPTRLARELTSLRRQMVVDLDREALTRLDEAGSAAAERDVALLQHLRSSGIRYRGVTMTVRTAQLQRTKGVSAVLRVVVDESAYSVRGPGGMVERRSARPGQEVDLVLVWDGASWRVRDAVGLSRAGGG